MSLDLLDQLRPIFATLDQPVYLVGGTVRDLILDRPSADLDFAVQRNAIKVTFAVADALGHPAYVMDRDRDVARIVLPDGLWLDFAGFRAANDSTTSLEADLRDRDFTINAIALEIRGDSFSTYSQNKQAVTSNFDEYIDPTGGVEDLKHGIVRQTNPRAIDTDPARALRAIRMAQQFGFEIELETQTAIGAISGQLWRISAERVRDGLLKLLMLNQPADAIRQLQQYNLLAEIIPELPAAIGVTQSPPHHEDVFDHILSVVGVMAEIDQQLRTGGDLIDQFGWSGSIVEKLRAHFGRTVDGGFTGYQLLRLAALFHDVGKPETRSVDDDGRIRFFTHEHVGADLSRQRLNQLKFSKAAAKHVQATVKGHMRLFNLAREKSVSRRAIFRFYKAFGDAGLDICLHSLADHLARDRHDDMVDRLIVLINTLLTHYFEEFESSVKPPKLIDGGDLIRELGIKPGPDFGRILDAVTEGQAAGEITTREQALALARQLL